MAASTRKFFEIFVSKVPWTVANKELKEYFGQFGQVKKCVLTFDKETGFHKGFCWIRFSSEKGVTNVLEKDTHVLEGAKLEIKQNTHPLAGQRSYRDADFD